MQAAMKVTTQTSLDKFAAHSARWNQLWESSDAYEATSRCEGIVHWVRSFDATENFRAITVESAEGELLLSLIHI